METPVHTVVVASAMFGLALAGCRPTQDAPPAAQEPASAPAAPAPSSESAQAQTSALVAMVKALVEADDACDLSDNFQPRNIDAFDLGGRTGVFADCSNSIADVYGRLYVADLVGNPVATPLLVFDSRGDGQWRAETQTRTLQFDDATKTISGTSLRWATGCGWSAKWKWNGTRVALVEMKTVGCPSEETRETVIWPTKPPTPEPTPVPLSPEDQ